MKIICSNIYQTWSRPGPIKDAAILCTYAAFIKWNKIAKIKTMHFITSGNCFQVSPLNTGNQYNMHLNVGNFSLFIQLVCITGGEVYSRYFRWHKKLKKWDKILSTGNPWQHCMFIYKLMTQWPKFLIRSNSTKNLCKTAF